MTENEPPTLEDALDGLITAAKYCDNQNYRGLDYTISHLYQVLGARSIEDKPTPETDQTPVLDGHARVTVDGNTYTGPITVEPWTRTSVNNEFIDDLDTDLGSVIEFWDPDNDYFDGDLTFNIQQTRALIIDLLRVLDDQLRIQYNREDLVDDERDRREYTPLDELDTESSTGE